MGSALTRGSMGAERVKNNSKSLNHCINKDNDTSSLLIVCFHGEMVRPGRRRAAVDEQKKTIDSLVDELFTELANGCAARLNWSHGRCQA